MIYIYIYIPGSKKKASFCTLPKSSPKFSATEDNCGVGQIPEEMLQRLMDRNSLNLNPPFFQRNAGKNMNKIIAFCTCAMSYYELHISFHTKSQTYIY